MRKQRILGICALLTGIVGLLAGSIYAEMYAVSLPIALGGIGLIISKKKIIID